MVQVTLNPHSTTSVRSFEFYKVDYPERLNVGTLVDLEPQNSNPFDVSDKVVVDKKFTHVFAKTDLTFDWNVIVSRSSTSAGTRKDSSTYLGMAYWDIAISKDEPFKSLSVTYKSELNVVPSENLITISASYVDHTRNEAIPKDTSKDQYWFSHPWMDRVVGGLKVPKTKWSFASDSVPEKVSVQQSDRLVNGYSDSSTIKPTSSLYTEGYIPKGYRYECIPSGVTSDCALLASSRFGVGLYEPKDGTVHSQNTQANFNLCKAPTDWELTRDKVYQFGTHVTLFYYPETYTLKVSCRNADQTWQTPWTVGETGKPATSEFKVVVPSFVDIIPFVFLYDNSEWNIIHLRGLSSDYKTLMKFGLQGTNSIEYNFDGQYGVEIGSYPVETFFSDIRYLNTYMFNEVYGYTPTEGQHIRDYWYVQLYLAYQTFVQVLRYHRTENPQMMDCGIRVGDKFYTYSQFTSLGYNSKSKVSSNCIEVPGLVDVDNFVFYNGSKLIYPVAINKGITGECDVSSYTNVQMKHGVIIGKVGGGSYVQLQ